MPRLGSFIAAADLLPDDADPADERAAGPRERLAALHEDVELASARVEDLERLAHLPADKVFFHMEAYVRGGVWPPGQHVIPADPLGTNFRDAVQTAITDFLDARRAEVSAIGPELDLPLDLANVFTGGGKRIRPTFCYWGRVAAGGAPDDVESLVRAAASLDLLHVSALMHDDVMDASDTRRGQPAAHRQFAALHADRRLRGDADAFGRGGAILLGDLALVTTGVHSADRSLFRFVVHGATERHLIRQGQRYELNPGA